MIEEQKEELCPNGTCDGSGRYEDQDGRMVDCQHTVEAKGDDHDDFII